MSYALAPRAARPNPLPSSLSAREWSDIAPATITVTPACDGVYCYSVSESSAWTSADLLRILRAIVNSDATRPTDPSV